MDKNLEWLTQNTEDPKNTEDPHTHSKCDWTVK